MIRFFFFFCGISFYYFESIKTIKKKFQLSSFLFCILDDFNLVSLSAASTLLIPIITMFYFDLSVSTSDILFYLNWCVCSIDQHEMHIDSKYFMVKLLMPYRVYLFIQRFFAIQYSSFQCDSRFRYYN